jgi:hypothetical protein
VHSRAVVHYKVEHILLVMGDTCDSVWSSLRHPYFEKGSDINCNPPPRYSYACFTMPSKTIVQNFQYIQGIRYVPGDDVLLP